MPCRIFFFSMYSILYFSFIIFLTFMPFFYLTGDLSAVEINRIEITGNTIDLDTAADFRAIKGELSKKDIEALGIKVTNEYHDRGYTTSYVERLSVGKDGVLQIRVKESKILGLNITGPDGNKKGEIENAFNPLIGSIYNKLIIEKKAGAVKRNFNMDAVKIYPVNYENTGDVFLSIKLSKEARGNLYGGIGFEPIYGLTPELGYYYPFTNSAADINAKAGYREGKFRMAEGDVKYFIFPDNDPRGFYAGSNIAMHIESWESRNSEFKKYSLSPVLGYRSIYQFIFIDLYIREIISDVKNYKLNEKEFRDYDTRLTLDFGFTNRVNLLSKKDATDLKISVSSGRSEISEKTYLMSSAEARSGILSFAWIRLIPSIYSYYTTSKERYFWQYVYDKRLLGFFDDFTASKFKNTAGLEIEFEVIPQFVYIGPFVNTGYFLNETLDWKSRTGGGAKSTIDFKNAYIEIYYAWDLSKEPSDGGFALLAGGRF